ncbi:MAG: PilZ domain-containing protein [Vicinamibacterales bacterium]
MSSSIVLIGPSEALPGLKERFDPGAEFQTFTEMEALEALDHIIRTKPVIVALDLEFSSSTRGTALINRIKDDPSLTGCEVRVLAHDSEMSRVAVKRGGGGAAVAVDEPKAVLDQKGTRRAARFRMKEGVEITVDGNPAIVIDLSLVGAQVVSNTVLKPNQRVRVMMGDGKAAVRCPGALAWASFEMPKGLPPRYRGGIDFMSPDADGIDAFTKKHKVE